jgi:hypothetical protein
MVKYLNSKMKIQFLTDMVEQYQHLVQYVDLYKYEQHESMGPIQQLHHLNLIV